MRERTQAMHEKINEKFIGTFRGKIEERKVSIDRTTGRIDEGFFPISIDYLDIPITIYTPIDVSRDKMVVFFHGGGRGTMDRREAFLLRKYA